MRVENYGPFARLEEITFSSLSTIIGRNDAGKSHTLKALQLFFGKNKLEAGDVYDSADITDQVVIEVSLTALPETLDYEGGAIHLADERLLDTDGRLRVRKMFPCAGPYDRPLTVVLNSVVNVALPMCSCQASASPSFQRSLYSSKS